MAEKKPQKVVTIQFRDFQPDVDSTNQGVVTGMQWMWSVSEGVWEVLAAPNVQASLGAHCYGAYQGQVNVTQMSVYGTQNQLWTWNGLNFNPAYLSLMGGTNPWNFTIYGNDFLACNGVDPVLVSNSGGPFGVLGGSPPVASIVTATDYSLFLIVANSNQWYSTVNDTLWTPNIGTQTVTNSLTSTPGIITACKALRNGVMIYKNSSAFYGSFTGPPFFWAFSKVSAEHGTWCNGSVVSIGELHYLVGSDEFYMTDGYTMAPIPNKLRRWFFNTVNQRRMGEIRGYYDHPHERIVWHFPSTAAATGVLDLVVHYSLKTGYWGIDSLNVDCPVDGTFPADGSYPGITMETCSYVDSSHFLTYLNGTGGLRLGSITSYDIGDKTSIWNIKRVQPVFPIGPPTGGAVPPSPPQLVVWSAYVFGQPPLQTKRVPFSPIGFFDYNGAGRFQRLQIEMLPGMQIASLQVEIEQQGSQ